MATPNKKNRKRFLIIPFVILLLLLGFYYMFFYPIRSNGQDRYLYVDKDDNADSLYTHLTEKVDGKVLIAVKWMERVGIFRSKIKPGCYLLESVYGPFGLLKNIHRGRQHPISLVIPSVRTTDMLARELGRQLMADSTEIATILHLTDSCKAYGFDTLTIPAMFVPNTYEIYWNTSVSGLFKRMKEEYHAFWDGQRQELAKRMNLTPIQVTTLASIIDEETAYNPEKPDVAGMYYNRLTLRNAEYPNGMPLQADPTVKFALKDFALKRIYQKHLSVQSPYNTYRNTGLPPGPIRIPSVAAIDAVLHYKHHPYYYMCADPAFNGRHIFAETYAQHMTNAKRYAEALNSRGIK